MNLKKSAFTLVELIIVITILAILATIAFVSFQNYVKDSRDSNRLTALKNIETGLQAFQIKTGNYPEPENPIIITASGTPITKQGFFESLQSSLIGLNHKPLDPKDQQSYIYATTQNNRNYQLLSYLESSQYTSTISNTYANDFSQRIPKVLGDKIGIILHENNDIITQSVDLVNATGSYKVILDNKNIITGTGYKLADLENSESKKAYFTYKNLSEITQQKKVLIIYQSYHGPSISRELENNYKNRGFQVITDTGAHTLEKVQSYQPDIIVCDEYAWSCGFSFLNTLYNAGYNIVSIGNDTTNSIILPIQSGSLNNPTPGNIVPYNTRHFISRGWTNTPNTGADSRFLITSIHPNAFAIAKDNLLNTIEVMYLEEDQKGRWIHYQGILNINKDLFDRANAYLLRD